MHLEELEQRLSPSASQFGVNGFPSPVTAGTAASFTVTAEDSSGQIARDYRGSVHISSSDGHAVLPPNYTFTATDQGTHTFQATLKTAGSQYLKATDTLTPSITGRQAGIVVNPAAVSKLVVSGFPSSILAGALGYFRVSAKDAYGNIVTGYRGTVDFASSSPSAALPAPYTFTSNDLGRHTFAAALNVTGSQSLTVVDASSGLAGRQSGIHVTQRAGNTYYVSPTGSDSNPGTITRPFLTINHGVRMLHAGDTLYVRAGTYGESLIDVIPSGTSWSAPVTIAAYPGEIVTLRPGSGQFVIELYGNYHYIIFNRLILDATHITDSGFYLDNAGRSATANHIRLENSEVKNAPNQGVIVGCGNNIPSNYNEFIHVVSHNNGPGSNQHHGFYISSSHTLLDGCEAYGNGGMGIQIYRGGGINGVDASYNLVRNCKLHDNGTAGLEIGIGNGNIADNNLIWNNPSGIFVEYGASHTKLYNNTIYNSTNAHDYAIRIGYSGGASNTIVKNNIVWATAGPDAIANYGAATICSYNLGDKVMQNERTGTGSFSHNLAGSSYNPLFVDAATADFHLQAGSPAIDAGTALTLVPTDFAGVTRPQGLAYDIGAFEYHG